MDTYTLRNRLNSISGSICGPFSPLRGRRGAGIVAAVLFLLTACSAQEEVVFQNRDADIIAFSIRTPTRAANSFGTYCIPDQFRVMAFNGTTNYFQACDNALGVSSSSGIDSMTLSDAGLWTGAVRYWPSNMPDDWNGLTFVAFVDDENLDGSSSFGYSTAAGGGVEARFGNYEVNPDVSKQGDLMYAVTKDAQNGSAANGMVGLTFRHALCQVGFAAENRNPKYEKVKITGISVNGVYGKGSFTLPDASTSVYVPDAAGAAGGWMGNWTVDETSNPTSYAIDNLDITLSAPVYDEDALGYRGDVVDCTGLAGQMNLIPQTLIAADEELTAGSYFLVRFQTMEKDAANFGDEKFLVVPVSSEWVQGQRYLYNLIFDDTTVSYDEVGSFSAVVSGGKFVVGADNKVEVYMNSGWDSAMDVWSCQFRLNLPEGVAVKAQEQNGVKRAVFTLGDQWAGLSNGAAGNPETGIFVVYSPDQSACAKVSGRSLVMTVDVSVSDNYSSGEPTVTDYMYGDSPTGSTGSLH